MKHCVCAKLCPTFCDPMDCNLPGSSVYGILQARIPEWAAILFFRGFSWLRDQTHVSMFPALAYKFFTTNTIWKAKEERGDDGL